MSDIKYTIHVRFRKVQHQIALPTPDPTCEEIAAAITSVTAADRETIKLSIPGKPAGLLHLQAHVAERASQMGLRSGSTVVMYASTEAEVQHVRTSKDLPGMAGFQQELKQHMRRQRGSNRITLKIPSGPYTFQGFEAWQQPLLSPPPSDALKLLHRLAADPGIAGIMSKHAWSVGLLSEMPPEGKVGVSPVCILGVNINRGQEISLRLRTDDLKGFRRYDRIRETLCHELAHMVWGEHDNRFKQLNSQLLKECGQLDWTGHAAHALQVFEDPTAATWVDEDDVMAVTAQTSGQTLRQLTGDQQHSPAMVSGSPRRAAAMAASARLAALVCPPVSRSASRDPLHQTVCPSGPVDASAPGALSSKRPTQANFVQSLPLQAGVTATDDGSAAEVAADPAADIAKLGHRDASTEQAEEAMRQLGSMDFSSEAQQLSSPDGAAAHHISPDIAEYKAQVQASVPDATLVAVQHQVLPQVVKQDDAEMHIATDDDQHSHSIEPAQQAAVQTHPSAPCSPALSLQHCHSRQLPTETNPPPQPLHSSNAARLDTTADLHMHGQERNSSMPAAAVDQTAQAASPAQLANVTGAPDSHPATISAADPAQAATALRPVHPMAQSEGAFQHGHACSSAEASAASESLMDVDADDPAMQRYRKAEAAVAHLRAEAGAANQLAALQTLLTILRNIVSHPGESKFSQIRLGNPSFHSRAGQFTAARELLAVAGFTEEAAGAVDRVLVWKRHDQGLLWLTLSAVENALQQVS